MPDLEPSPITGETFLELTPEKFELVDGYLFRGPHMHRERKRLLAILLTNEGLIRAVQLAPLERWEAAIDQVKRQRARFAKRAGG